MIKVTQKIVLPLSEIKFTFIVSPGPGGQNVNKTATTAQLRFNVLHSPSLPEEIRARLMALLGKKITGQGELLIKASRHRTQERNKQDALARLCQLIKRAAMPQRVRKKTKPTWASRQDRLTTKKRHGVKKALRRDKGE